MASSESYTKEEGTVTLEDGHKIYTCTWKPQTPPKAQILFLHGFSDHSHAYHTFFPSLTAHSLLIHSFDQRGWGRSCHTPADRGATGPTTQTLAEVDTILSPILASASNLPTFLVGHSMGGGLALLYGHRGSLRSKLAGIVSFSPLIDIAEPSRPSQLIVWAGKLAARILPKMHMPQPLAHTDMSRDLAVCEAFRDDELCHDTGTLEGLAEMLERARWLRKEVGNGWDKNVPALVLHGTGDRVTCCKASQRFVEGLKAKGGVVEGRWLDGWFHKMHAEPGKDRDVFVEEVAGWILKRVGELGGTERQEDVHQGVVVEDVSAPAAVPVVGREEAKESARL